MDNKVKGQVVSGRFGEIQIRKKSDEDIELGELLIAKTSNGRVLLQVYDLLYGSQLNRQNLELISGMKLEEDEKIELFDENLRNYNLALAKNVININDNTAVSSKSLPLFFSEVRSVTEDDVGFITRPKNPLLFGNLRSGTKELGVPVFLNGEKVFSHHMLVVGTTGKGKSVFMSNLLWDCVDKDYCSLLVLDPHDEYFGRDKIGLKDHQNSERIVYYSYRDVPSGQRTLKINIKNVKPEHLNFLDFSGPQQQALNAYYKEFHKSWVESVILEKPLKVNFDLSTLGVLRRRILQLLDLDFYDNKLFCNGVFDLKAGELTIRDIVNDLENNKTVIIDTSSFSGQLELLIGSMVTSEIFNRYKNHKRDNTLKKKPVISIVLEEAPRVLGKQVLENGRRNIFEIIAREGRKFRIGLIAITQLPSLIPREILANINTKLILGVEMNSERQALIESASQDLSTDNRNIASLDKGEAIVTSNFAPFAIPIRIPFFDEEVRKIVEKNKSISEKEKTRRIEKINFSGVKIENDSDKTTSFK